MDKIYVNGMEFYGYHGVFPEETRLGQKFIVDLMAETELREAGTSDNLEKSVHYGELFETVKAVVEGKPYKLVESVAEKISERVLSDFPRVHTCTVKVYKPNPPIPGHYESVAIEIVRGRSHG
ncbi:dihydroneopterin aldolase [Bacillus massiliglaciei]|uniref:dihydroneopterin aldolase n=1 Tax=Bacillus massiliglaciei TaxID=1816693 RepID=UPI000A7A6A78|nr:dihydroneopterin aldolase [Bacillus massiliglaciei]